jgi:hypothetical protein
MNGRRRRIGTIFQASIDCGGPIARQYVRDVDLVAALHLPDLLGAALFGGLAILGGNGVRVDQLLRESRSFEYAYDDQAQLPGCSHGNFLKAFSSEVDICSRNENAAKQ